MMAATTASTFKNETDDEIGEDKKQEVSPLLCTNSVAVAAAEVNEYMKQKEEAGDDEHKSSSSLSKRALKKLAKKLKWENSKDQRRAKTKAKRKQLRDKVKQGLVAEGLSRKQKKSNTMLESRNRVGIAIDMSFNNLMIEKDMAKCIKQIHRCYSVNRKQKDPVQFYVTSFGGVAQESIKKHSGWEHWDVNFTSKSYDELENFQRERVVYLSSESDNILTELKPDYLYIIGGLVDHNSHKGLCHSLAVQNGISHAKLPISEYLHMESRKVLTIDHVFEILVNVSQSMPWEKAMMDVIAPRKMAQPKMSVDS